MYYVYLVQSFNAARLCFIFINKMDTETKILEIRQKNYQPVHNYEDATGITISNYHLFLHSGSLTCSENCGLIRFSFTGMTHVKCHEKFKKCLRKVVKSGKTGFSNECPYSISVPTMIRGMDVAITLSQMGQTTIDL